MVGGHRRIATALFLRYAKRAPNLVLLLLSIDLDAAKGRLRSARAYAAQFRTSHRVAVRVLEEYAAHAGELEPAAVRRARPRRNPEPGRQVPLLLPYGRTRGTGTGERKARENVGLDESGDARGRTRGHTPKIREPEKESAHAREPDRTPEELARWRAARALLAGTPDRFNLEAISKLAAELPPERVAEVLEGKESETAARAARERSARTAEAMRHEGPRIGGRRG